ncbi:MAG: hypothetical protein CNIPEHKO_02313 [Anaerolineales bacterium]|nr:hypothetical protein [Anaerolineales bacterium]
MRLRLRFFEGKGAFPRFLFRILFSSSFRGFTAVMRDSLQDVE